MTLLGWGCGSVKAIGALAGEGSAGWRSAIGSPIVGVFVSSSGTLFVLVDQRGVGLVEATGKRFTAAIGHCENRRWILLRDGSTTVALRLFGSRIA